MNGKRLIFILLSLTFLLFLSSEAFAQADLGAGKKLFKAKCATCHNKNMKTKLTGPPLAGWSENWSRPDIYEWVRNSKKMIDAGHPRAVAIWNEYKPTSMDPFPDLTDADIDNIMAYVDEIVVAGCYPCTPGVTNGPGEVKGGDQASNKWLYWLLFGVLAILAIVMMRIVANLNHMALEAKGQAPAHRQTLWDMLTSRGVVSFAIFALVVLGGYTTANNAISLGRQQAYAPTQPIEFSHKLHAGVHKIDCQYCHDGARRSKHAVIPAVNTCMNCHRAVQEGPTGNKEEIAKIYEAAGFDVEKNVYTGEEKPIEWVRIHNLPDHVYFNHAQHVTVGKVECETCHGKVEEMDKLEQYAPLSMGWCVNCHRETEVKFDNEYYDSWENYHKDLEGGKIDKVTVEDIGGLECQKCHY